MKDIATAAANNSGQNPAKKPWVSPSVDVLPANLAEVTGGGAGDGVSCHS